MAFTVSASILFYGVVIVNFVFSDFANKYCEAGPC